MAKRKLKHGELKKPINPEKLHKVLVDMDLATSNLQITFSNLRQMEEYLHARNAMVKFEEDHFEQATFDLRPGG